MILLEVPTVNAGRKKPRIFANIAVGSLIPFLIILIVLACLVQIDLGKAEFFARKIDLIAKYLGVGYLGYRSGFMVGTSPIIIYDAMIVLSIWWAIFSGFILAIDFITTFGFFTNPVAYVEYVKALNSCNAYDRKILIVRVGMVFMWIGVFLMVYSALNATVTFFVHDFVITVLIPLLIACAGLLLLWIPLSVISFLLYDAKSIYKLISGKN